jgi:hypothetical protein
MRWIKVTPWKVRSECRRYMVVKHELFDGEWGYQPHYLPHERAVPVEIQQSLLRSMQEAELVCIDHQAGRSVLSAKP